MTQLASHLLAELCERQGAPHQRPLPRRRLATILAAATMIIGGAAVANEHFGGGTYVVEEPGSEDGNGVIVGGDDANETYRRLAADIPLPPGHAFDEEWLAGAGYDGWSSETGVAGVLGFRGACHWYVHWHNAHTSGDTATADAALATLRDIPTWPQIVAVSSDLQTFERVSGAAAAGDAGTVADFLDVNCGQVAGWDAQPVDPADH